MEHFTIIPPAARLPHKANWHRFHNLTWNTVSIAILTNIRDTIPTFSNYILDATKSSYLPYLRYTRASPSPVAVQDIRLAIKCHQKSYGNSKSFETQEDFLREM